MNTYTTYSTVGTTTHSGVARRNTIAPQRSLSHYKLFRFIAFLLIILAAITFGAMMQVFAGNDRADYAPEAANYEIPEAVIITVMPGDTLWDIAAQHAPKGSNLQQYIFDTMKLNDLKTSSLSIGQVLQLPQS